VTPYKARVIAVSVFLVIFFLAVVGKLFTIQILDGGKYAMNSKMQAQKLIPMNARRGDIYDRRGRQLAVSAPGRLTLGLDVLGVDSADGKAVLQRVYPMGEVAGPLLGYMSKDGSYGLSGAEYKFDTELRGEHGWEIVHRDGKQRTYRKIGLPKYEPKDGADLYLTIDVNLQKIVHSVLKQTVESLNAKGAMCIVMDPRTGKILAMANEPSFNPNIPSSYSLADRQNKPISFIYEPGSTFKAVTASVALQEGAYAENDLINGNNGAFEIYGEVIRDDTPQGMITFARAIAVSSNVCFAQIASGFKNEHFYRYVRDFGFGAKTGIALPGEESGILRPANTWSGRTRVSIAFGYEVSATFLQMMLAYAAVANGGVLLTPIICERIEKKNGTITESAKIKPVRRVISEETARRLRKMMQGVVETGTGKQAIVPGIPVGGKTGTSRKSEAGGYTKQKHWSSFIGFLPVEEPTLLCGVVIDEPAGGTGGGAAAAPAFRKIMSLALAHPELDFSDKILKPAAVQDSQSVKIKLPDFSGRKTTTVTAQLDSMKISFRVVGGGGTVRHQTPAAGAFAGNKIGEVVLFTDEPAPIGDGAVRVIPDAVGKELRDAFNIFNAKGIPIYAVGSGKVLKQSVAPGEIMNKAVVCTLYCDRKK
jgi:cell division protein FtsI/penicillin-binding protein 2